VALIFIDRESEIKLLEQLHKKEAASLVLLYGRRRIGKTRLIQEFMKHAEGIYFYTPNSEEKTILTELSRAVEDEFFKGFRFTDFTAFLSYIERKCQEGAVIAIDEFQRLSNIDGAISLIQRRWDEKLSTGKGLIILSGSSIGATHRLALRGDAPLHGRRTATIKLEPLKYLDLEKWFRNYPAEELVRIYGSFGGTPAYLEYIDHEVGVDANIVANILAKNSPLHDEPETLLMGELRSPQRYMDILSTLAQGRNTITDIANSTGINRENVSTYLSTLGTLDLVERITPVTAPRAKKGLYAIRDPFFRFWFRFVRPNKRQLELGLENNVWESAKEEFNQHLGYIFEDICVAVITAMGKKGMLPLRIDRIGRWWMKDAEIDILVLEKRGGALAVEAKWSEVSYREGKRLLSALSKKATQVPDIEEPTLGVIAKKLEEKEKLREEGFWVLDLDDFKDRELNQP